MKKRFEIKNWISVIVLAALFVVLGTMSGGKLITPLNIKNLLEQSLPIIIGGAGVIYIIAMGSTDLSIGGTAAVSATAACMVASRFGFVWFFPVSIAIGLGIGLLNGIVVSKCRVSSFMTTLAMLIGLKGLLAALVGDNIIIAPMQIIALNKIQFKVVFTIVVVVVFGFIFESTRFGRYCKVMGENEQMVLSMGVNVNKIRIIAYVISGFIGSLVGIMMLIQQGGSSTTMGSFLEMKVMMAIYLGGVLVSGGLSSKVYKMIIGAFTISVMVTGLYLAGISPDYLNAIEGVLLMSVLFLTMRFNRGKGRTE